MHLRSQYHAHLEVKTRSEGQSAAAAIAYICALDLRDVWLNERHNFTRRRGVLKYACVNFDGSPSDLAALLDGTETRGNSRVGRSLDIALPKGLSVEQRWQLAIEIAKAIARFWKVPIVVALHAPSEDGDPRNDHAHIVFGTREIEHNQLTTKTRLLDDLKTGPVQITRLRSEISGIIAALLVTLGRGNEVTQWDHRSYQKRGISRVPGKHRGPRQTRVMRKLPRTPWREIDDEISAMIGAVEREETERAIASLEQELPNPPRQKSLWTSIEPSCHP